MTDPTPAQLRVLRHVMRFQAEHGFSPSIRNLVDVLGLASTNAVHEQLDRLTRDGLLTRYPHVARSLRITELGWRWLKLPTPKETTP